MEHIGFAELSPREMQETDGGIGVLAAIGIGLLALGGGFGIGYGLSRIFG